MTFTSETSRMCEREVKDDSRFFVCMKGRIMVPFTEMRKTKGGGHLGGANQEFWFGCIKGSSRYIKWLFG